MIKLLLGAVLAGIVLMLWGWVTWGLLAGTMDIVRPPAEERALAAALGASIPEDGTYFLPWEGMEGDAQEQAAWKANHESGPIALLFVRTKGQSSDMGAMMGGGLVHFIVSAFLAGLLLKMALPALGSYGARVGLVAFAGLFGAFAMELPLSVWWYVPWSYTLFNFFATVVAWFLAGLVLAAFVKPTSA